LGVLALIVAGVFPASSHKPIVVIVGVIALFFAVYNIFSTSFAGANLESPLDLLLHLVVGIWALTAAKGRKSSPVEQSMPQM